MQVLALFWEDMEQCRIADPCYSVLTSHSAGKKAIATNVVTARWVFPLSPTIPNTLSAQHSPPAPKMQAPCTASAAHPAPKTRHQTQPNPASSAHPPRECSRAGKLLERTAT